MDENLDLYSSDNLGRKRKSNPSEWKKNKGKTARLKGEEYEDYKGRKVPALTIGEPCGCARLKCFDSISKEEQTAIFRQVHDIPKKDDQDFYIQSLIDLHEVQRRRPRKTEGARQLEKVFSYHVMIGDERREVCFKAFLSLFGITAKRVKRLRKLAMIGQCPYDGRGKRRKSSGEILPEDVQQMMVQNFYVSE